MSKTRFGVTAATLKWLALLSMLLDHAAIILPPLWKHYYPLRAAGRIAFPLYLFLLLEGYEHTRSRGRYLLRLGAFALVSEFFYDFAFNSVYVASIAFSDQNVFFTLAIGFGCLMLIDWFWGRTEDSWERWLGAGLTTAAGALLAEFINCDYGAAGVLSLILAFLLRRLWRIAGKQENSRWKWTLIWLGLTAPLIVSSSWELWALAAVPLVCLYDGEKGRQPTRWFFYAFYPAHLLLLTLLAGALPH